MQVYIDLWTLINGFVEQSQTLKQHDWITGDKDFWKEVCGLLFLNWFKKKKKYEYVHVFCECSPKDDPS